MGPHVFGALLFTYDVWCKRYRDRKKFLCYECNIYLLKDSLVWFITLVLKTKC